MFKSIGRNNRLVMLSLLIWALGEGLWYNLRQLYLVELGATPAQVGTALALENIGRAAFLIPAGYMVDRIGSRQMMIASWLLGIAGIAVLGLARSWQGLIPGLMLYGSSAFAIPAVSAYALLSHTEEGGSLEAASSVIPTLFAAYPIGLIVSPWAGGLIADAIGIRACLWIAVLMYGISTLVMFTTWHVPPHPREATAHPGALFRDQGFVLRALYYMLAGLTLFTGFLLVPNFLQSNRGFSVDQVGFLFSILAGGSALVNLAAGRLPPRWAYPATLGLVWLALLGVSMVSGLAGVAVAFFPLGAIYSTRTVAMAGISRIVKPEDRGLAFGTLEMLLSAAMGVAARIAGTLFEMTPGHDLPQIAALVGIPIMAAAWFAARVWRAPHAPESDSLPLKADGS